MFIIILVLLVIAITVYYVVPSTTYVDESLVEANSHTADVIVESSLVADLLNDNETSIAELATVFDDLKFKTDGNSTLEPIVDILNTEYNLLIMKNEQMKGLLLENESLAYDADVNMTPTIIEGLTRRPMSTNRQEREEIVKSIKQKLDGDKVTIPEKGVIDAIGKLNEKSVDEAKKITSHITNSTRVVKRVKLSINDVNKKRAARGKPVITAERIATRKAKIKERKEQKQQKRTELRAARDEFKNENNPTKRKAAKAKFLMLVQKYKNRNKKDKMTEKEINNDEATLIDGEDVREIKPVVDVAVAVKANTAVAKNIDAEIMIKEKIIVDAIEKIEDNTVPPNEIIQGLIKQTAVDTELTANEEAMIADIDI